MFGRPLREVFPALRGATDADVVVEARGIHSGMLRNVSFAARAGCVLGVVGLEGSGIRELGRVLVGDQPLDRGELLLEGRSRRFHQPAAAAKAGVAYLSSDRKRDGLFSILSVAHNITIASLDREQQTGVIDRGTERQRVRESIRQLSIHTPSTRQEVRFLSGGNQQKVLLARWLGAEPRIFIMDEPTRGIDVGSKAEIYAIMRGLADGGAAVIMISTDLTEILGMSDEILVLHAGQVAVRLPGGVDEGDVLPHVLGAA
jgi:ribose transport system ATP-binding protein